MGVGLPLIDRCVNQDAAFRLTGVQVLGQLRGDQRSPRTHLDCSKDSVLPRE